MCFKCRQAWGGRNIRGRGGRQSGQGAAAVMYAAAVQPFVIFCSLQDHATARFMQLLVANTTPRLPKKDHKSKPPPSPTPPPAPYPTLPLPYNMHLTGVEPLPYSTRQDACFRAVHLLYQPSMQCHELESMNTISTATVLINALRAACLSCPGASIHLVTGTDAQTAPKSISRKQLHFAPLQLGRISEQPQKSPSADGMADELLSPGRSKSLGAAVDRALLKGSGVAESAVSKDRPHSATQCSRWVSATPCSAPPRLIHPISPPTLPPSNRTNPAQYPPLHIA